MVAFNPEWFTLAPDNTTEELRNGAKDKHQPNCIVLVKCVENVVQRKDQGSGNQGTKMGLMEKIT